MSEDSFPIADTKTGSAKSIIVRGVSRMWIATIVCLLVAIVLTWYSMGDSGIEIVLHFKQGHGLKPGDALRDRGIDIGEVTHVQLNKGLDGIEVQAELHAAAQGIAREGSRFWIVRPTLDLTGISGLETAVGSKYIAVSPGPIASPVLKTDFIGLESPPVDELGEGGLELVLRGDERFGVNPGSPVTWRGIEVGQVLSSALSPDALHVDTRIRISPAHRRLVAGNTKFWVTSGIHFDAGVTGFEFSAESLATIIRGGIAFITPQPVSDRTVDAGEVFTLHERVDDDWIADAAVMNLLEVHPPPVIELVAMWQQKVIGFKRSKTKHAIAVVLNDGGQQKALVPVEFSTAPDAAIDGSFQINIAAETESDDNPKVDWQTGSTSDTAIARLPVSGPNIGSVKVDRLRVAELPEDCFAVRQPRNGGVVLEAIGQHELTVDGKRWRTTKSGLSEEVWNGAPVLAAKDEKIIGVLSITDDHIYVVPLSN